MVPTEPGKTWNFRIILGNLENHGKKVQNLKFFQLK